MKYVKPITLFQGLLKSNLPVPGCLVGLDVANDLPKSNSPVPERLLGLDVGNKYVGLAVSDSHNKIASPLSVLVRKKTNIDLMAKDFQTLISELSLGGLVIGCCYDNRQRTSLEAVQVKLFVKELCKTGKLEGVSYTYWDERFTTKCVEVMLHGLHLPPVMSKTILDKFAAVGILQDYLDDMRRTPELDKSSL